MTGSRLFTGELMQNVVALTPPFRGTAASRLQRPDSHICDVYHRDREWPRNVVSGSCAQGGRSPTTERMGQIDLHGRAANDLAPSSCGRVCQFELVGPVTTASRQVTYKDIATRRPRSPFRRPDPAHLDS
jgi:hypothetical protein